MVICAVLLTFLSLKKYTLKPRSLAELLLIILSLVLPPCSPPGIFPDPSQLQRSSLQRPSSFLPTPRLPQQNLPQFSSRFPSPHPWIPFACLQPSYPDVTPSVARPRTLLFIFLPFPFSPFSFPSSGIIFCLYLFLPLLNALGL